MDHYGLKGKVALITGGSRNIGSSIARAMASAGANPVILYHEDKEGAQRLCDEMRTCGRKAGMYHADLVDVARLRAMVRQVESEFGSVDILVNNAAIRPRSRISQITVEVVILLKTKNFQDMLATRGVVPDIGTPEDFWKFMLSELSQ